MQLKRLLYSKSELGITNYGDSRIRIAKFVPNSRLFRENLHKKLDDPKYTLTITDLERDLNLFLRLMVEDESDVNLLHKTLQTLVVKRETYTGHLHLYDCVIFRAFHYLGLADAAIRVISYKMLTISVMKLFQIHSS